MTLGDGFDQCQTQTHSAAALTGSRQPEKRLKDPLAVFRWNTGTPVTHTQDDFARLSEEAQAHCIFLACGGAVADRIFEQIAHQTPKQSADAVDFQHGHALGRIEPGLHPRALFGTQAHEIHRLV